MARTQELYDYAKIAAETGIDPAKLRVWHQRGKLPESDFRVGQSPAWTAATIHPWIQAQAAAPPDGMTSVSGGTPSITE